MVYCVNVTFCIYIEQMLESKKCSCCGEIKSIDNFATRTGAPDGHQAYCRACVKIISKRYRAGKANDKITINEIEEDNIPTDFTSYTKKCSGCGEVKSLDYFYKNATSTDGYSSRCSLCYKHQYQYNREAHNAKALKNYYEKQGREVPEHIVKMAEEKINTRVNSSSFSKYEYHEKVNQRREANRAHWKAVFEERRPHIEQLMRDYEANPGDSVELVERFHAEVRPTWQLNYGNETLRYENAVKNNERSNW